MQFSHTALALGMLAAWSLAGPDAAADEAPRRSIPLMVTGASGLSAGLTIALASGIVAAVTPCVTLPGLPSGCDPAFDNTFAAPLILVGGFVTVLSIPLLSIGLEREAPAASLAVSVDRVTLDWSF